MVSFYTNMADDIDDLHVTVSWLKKRFQSFYHLGDSAFTYSVVAGEDKDEDEDDDDDE